jgi:two-component system response regulator YesN
MYKVILVDDEEIIREGLRKTIDWHALGMEVAGTAEDGLDAMELIKELHPEIIITDIKMAFMDGLELIAEVKKIYPETMIIFISGHDEFEYARKAVSLGAFDYILKPIELEYLEKLLLKVRDKLDEARNMEKKINFLEEKLKDTKPILLERLFKDVIFGRAVNVKSLDCDRDFRLRRDRPSHEALFDFGRRLRPGNHDDPHRAPHHRGILARGFPQLAGRSHGAGRG